MGWVEKPIQGKGEAESCICLSMDWYAVLFG